MDKSNSSSDASYFRDTSNSRETKNSSDHIKTGFRINQQQARTIHRFLKYNFYRCPSKLSYLLLQILSVNFFLLIFSAVTCPLNYLGMWQNNKSVPCPGWLTESVSASFRGGKLLLSLVQCYLISSSNEKNRMLRPLDNACLGWCVPWSTRHLDDASLRRRVRDRWVPTLPDRLTLCWDR